MEKKYTHHSNAFKEEAEKALLDEPNTFLSEVLDLKEKFASVPLTRDHSPSVSLNDKNNTLLNLMIDDIYNIYYDLAEALQKRKDAIVAFVKGISVEQQEADSINDEK